MCKLWLAESRFSAVYKYLHTVLLLLLFLFFNCIWSSEIALLHTFEKQLTSHFLPQIHITDEDSGEVWTHDAPEEKLKKGSVTLTLDKVLTV